MTGKTKPVKFIGLSLTPKDYRPSDFRNRAPVLRYDTSKGHQSLLVKRPLLSPGEAQALMQQARNEAALKRQMLKVIPAA